jgi:enamine deaminase RidA (YjgF/YER057c/UK114 family)
MIEGNEAPHTRMGFGMNAKGLVQLDVTVSYPTPEEAAEAARKALSEFKAICAEQGLKIAEPAA